MQDVNIAIWQAFGTKIWTSLKVSKSLCKCAQGIEDVYILCTWNLPLLRSTCLLWSKWQTSTLQCCPTRPRTCRLRKLSQQWRKILASVFCWQCWKRQSCRCWKAQSKWWSFREYQGLLRRWYPVGNQWRLVVLRQLGKKQDDKVVTIKH